MYSVAGTTHQFPTLGNTPGWASDTNTGTPADEFISCGHKHSALFPDHTVVLILGF